MLAVIIVVGLLVVALAVFLVWKVLRPVGNSSDATMLLKADMVELTKSMGQLQQGLQKQLTEQLGTSNKQMAQQFQASAKIIKMLPKNSRS
ncbi:hypothetical protein COU91_04195 [Candidatus Saccharibacteria bacterium CG10_big_fil_rev_8_21_14_0_10_47_8]|nr:MAG: hypothetical protein COU91_04195 [Candidatus Saccharibacteria bacterium CG10_big_fil_rev_8_21_14_0_10_47_8]